MNLDHFTGVKVITPRSEDFFYIDESVKDIREQIDDIKAGETDILLMTKVIQRGGYMPAKEVLVILSPSQCSTIELWESKYLKSLDIDDDHGGIGLTD